MDIVTHALLGACTAHAAAAKRLPRSAWAIGALAGYAPDLDVLIRPASDPLGGLLWHRHFTHALAMVPLQAALITAAIILFARSLRASWKAVFLAASAAMTTHGLLDALTSYGTLIFWPFSNARVALDALPIIDPIVTLALIIALILAIREARRAAGSARRARALAAAGVAFVIAYAALGFIQRDRALNAVEILAAQRNHQPVRARALPQPLSLLLWRTIYEHRDTADQSFIQSDFVRTPIFAPPTAWRGSSVPVFTRTDLLTPEPGRPAPDETTITTFDRFNWFTDGWSARTDGDPLLIADMRYATRPTEAIALWGLRLPAGTSDRPLFGSAMSIRLRANELLSATLGTDERFTPVITPASPTP